MPSVLHQPGDTATFWNPWDHLTDRHLAASPRGSRSRRHVARDLVPCPTGGGRDPEFRAFLERAKNPLLEKPFTTEELHQVVSDLIGRLAN